MRVSCLASLAVFATACTGAIGGGSSADQPDDRTPGRTGGNGSATAGRGGTQVGSNGGAPAGPPAEACGDPGPSPLRRLSHAEYDATVRDLLGDKSNPAAGFAQDGVSGGFANQADALWTSPLLAEQYLNTAEALARKATEGNAVPEAATAVTCGSRACAQTFAQAFGKRAWRRPLADAETAALMKVYDAGRASADHRAGLQMIVEVLLQSPQFLYRPELGVTTASGTLAALTSWEMASRLSYAYLGTMPDAELFAAAERDELQQVDQVLTQARRLVADDRAREAFARFADGWLGAPGVTVVDKDPVIYPAFTEDVPAAMLAETRTFIDSVWNGSGDLRTLLTADYTFVDRKLFALYGLPGTAPTGTGIQKVTVGNGQRRGVLTQGSLLAYNANADESSPILRGKFVREQLLCTHIAEPPNDLEIKPPDPSPTLTTRERYDVHDSEPLCAGCHRLMDPLGLGFENYDGIGRFRATENGKPVDATGEIVDDPAGKFDGAAQLADKLAGSANVQACATSQLFRFTMGRPDTDDDACTMRELGDAFGNAKHDFRELLVQLSQTTAFRFRRSR